jgi:hypothetical protein
MVFTRSRRLLAGLVALVATVVVASPAMAAVSASYGTLTPSNPSVSACTGGTCMTTSATFTSNGTVSTNVTVSITLYRTAKAGATTASSTDYVVKTASATYATVKGTAASKVLTATQKCLVVATTAYGYYTKATMTNGTTAGTVTQNSAVVQLKGCVTV